MAEIMFVREYEFIGARKYDVIYKGKNGKRPRLHMYYDRDLPKTVKSFISNAKICREQTDKIHDKEIIYKEG